MVTGPSGGGSNITTVIRHTYKNKLQSTPIMKKVIYGFKRFALQKSSVNWVIFSEKKKNLDSEFFGGLISCYSSTNNHERINSLTHFSVHVIKINLHALHNSPIKNKEVQTRIGIEKIYFPLGKKGKNWVLTRNLNTQYIEYYMMVYAIYL